jgi:LysM repeat protein
LEQRSNPRSRVKLAVFFVLTIHVVGVLALLLQGCKREAVPDNQTMTQPDAPVVPPFEPTAAPPAGGAVTGAAPDAYAQPTPPAFESYTAVAPTTPQPGATPQPTMDPMTAAPSAGQTYKIKSGDTFYGLAKQFGVTMQAIAAANPNVDPGKLQIGQTINIPAPAPAQPAGATSTLPSGETIYVVRSGDTLTKIADRFGTTVKAIRSANNLQSTMIRVGDKLTIPTTQSAAPVPPAPAPAPGTPPAGTY